MWKEPGKFCQVTSLWLRGTSSFKKQQWLKNHRRWNLFQILFTQSYFLLWNFLVRNRYELFWGSSEGSGHVEKWWNLTRIPRHNDSHKRIYRTTTESHLKLLSFSLPQKTFLLRDPQRLYKVVFVGDSYVGKTSLMHRVCNNAFVESFNATIGKDNIIMLFYFPSFSWFFIILPNVSLQLRQSTQ